jgi:hypothetical protein
LEASASLGSGQTFAELCSFQGPPSGSEGARLKTFGLLSSIDPAQPSSWQGKIFLTFDIDWAHDDVLSETVDLVEMAEVPATWFLTHDTPVKARIRQNPKFELGIHPNFNFLLDGDARNGRNAREVIERLMEVVPEARSVRSHSITQSSVLIERFKEAGLTHESNYLVPHHSGIALAPYELWNGVCRVPYHWEDDVHFLHGHTHTMQDVLNLPGLQVFNFHPIHVYLNTEHQDRYELTRSLHRNPLAMLKYRNAGCGTRNRLLDIIGHKCLL